MLRAVIGLSPMRPITAEGMAFHRVLAVVPFPASRPRDGSFPRYTISRQPVPWWGHCCEPPMHWQWICDSDHDQPPHSDIITSCRLRRRSR